MIQIFVPHVKTGYEPRAEHIEDMLGRLGLPFEYILDGDIADITPQWRQKYFAEQGNLRGPIISCATKHLLIYERMVAQGIQEALVLEDDIFLKRKFLRVLEKTRDEMREKNAAGEPVWVGFEATCLKLVPRSQRERGRVVYPGKSLQCTGAYYINRAFAQRVLETAAAEKIDNAIDWYVDTLRQRGLVPAIYWSYPIVAVQGSHTGRMSSAIGNPVGERLWWVRIKRPLTMCYKEVVAFFR